MSDNEHSLCSRCTVFSSAQLLRKRRKQRPSNQGDHNSSVKVEAGRVCYRDWTDSGFSFGLQYIVVFVLRFKSNTLY
jgi:hypothetical protein